MNRQNVMQGRREPGFLLSSAAVLVGALIVPQSPCQATGSQPLGSASTQSSTAILELVPLAPLAGFDGSNATRISDNGVYILGASSHDRSDPCAVIYTVEGQNIAVRGIYPCGLVYWSLPGDVNDNGVATVDASTSAGIQSYVRRGQTLTRLCPLGERGIASGTAINNAGLIAGWSTRGPTGPAVPVTYELGVAGEGACVTPRIPSGLGAISAYPTAVNDSGDMVGTTLDARGVERGFIYTELDGFALLPALIPGGSCGALDINNQGLVVGWSQDGTGESVAVWAKFGSWYVLGLGRLPGHSSAFASAISERGWIVGSSSGPGGDRAFVALLFPLSRLIALDDVAGSPQTQGWRVTSASDISNSWPPEIVGTAWTPWGLTRGVLVRAWLE